MLEPAVKWSGSKRSQAAEIISRFPTHTDTYYEPFCGGCSVLRRLLDTDMLYQANRYVCSDLNEGLIDLWKAIKTSPSFLSDAYEDRWRELNRDSNLERKKRYFEEIRAEYNKTHRPQDFLFIMRTTTNVMPRYNANGEFNKSFHITRNGIEPNTLRRILVEWSNVLNFHDVEFRHASYNVWNPSENDLIYLDPPYAGTKGMYFGGFDVSAFVEWLSTLKCKWVLSFDGIAGDKDMTYQIPESIYKHHEYIMNGNSSFRRVIGKDRHCDFRESLYWNF